MTVDPTPPAMVSLQRFAEVLRRHVVSSGSDVELVRDTLSSRSEPGAHIP
jgi:hypothetical protein